MLMGAQDVGWFFGEDIVIDSICIFVLLLISYFSIKYYKIKKNRNILYLNLAFLLLAASFGLKIFLNLGAYYDLLNMGKLGYGRLILNDLNGENSLVFFFYFLYHAAALFGLYFFYSVYDKQSKSNIALIFYLVITLLYFSHYSPSTFHMTSFVTLSLVTLQSFTRYLNKKYPATRLLVMGLLIITLSQLSFMAAYWDKNLYVIGEITQLVGYVILLITLIAVLTYGRKANENRYYW